MALVILRIVFIVVASGIATQIFRSAGMESPWYPWLVFFGLIGLAGGVIVLDVFSPRKQIDVISSVYIGLLVGFLLTYVISIALAPIIDESQGVRNLRLIMGMILCYTCISLLIQTKDDFRF